MNREIVLAPLFQTRPIKTSTDKKKHSVYFVLLICVSDLPTRYLFAARVIFHKVKENAKPVYILPSDVIATWLCHGCVLFCITLEISQHLFGFGVIKYENVFRVKSTRFSCSGSVLKLMGCQIYSHRAQTVSCDIVKLQQ